MQIVAVNNMVLNLREFSSERAPSGLGETSIPELQFAANRYLGNVGAPIEAIPSDRAIGELDVEVEDGGVSEVSIRVEELKSNSTQM